MARTRSREWNQALFNAPEIVAEYAELGGLSPPEAHLVERYLSPGMDILDLGVGGGRTVPALRALARRYVGLDYAEGMVSICRERYPGLEFVVGDASDLSQFPDGSFDAVVFSFNGIDCLYPDAARAGCLRECRRVLRPGGVFIFSTHNPSGFVTVPRTRDLTRRVAIRRWAKEAYLALRRALNAARRALWRGEGYVVDPVHGGLLTHLASRRSVRRELRAHGFEHLETVASTHPRRRPGVIVGWYYYAFRRVPADDVRGPGGAGEPRA